MIDLPRTHARRRPAPARDIILRDGDRLIVPKFQQEVTVIGEVQTATSHLYRPELVARRLHRAERRRHAPGGPRQDLRRARRWQRGRERGQPLVQPQLSVEIKPGDTVVVPLDTERLPALPFWQAVTQIIYNLAISAAAVNSF